MNFVLPGTHRTFFPWVPPPRLPDSILLKLRNELLAACKAFVPTHSRHSPASSVASDAPRVPIENLVKALSDHASKRHQQD